MKAKANKKAKFEKVILKIELETQEEVDMLYAIFCHSFILEATKDGSQRLNLSSIRHEIITYANKNKFKDFDCRLYSLFEKEINLVNK